MEQTMPPITNGELQFYENHHLIKAYDGDKDFQTT